MLSVISIEYAQQNLIMKFFIPTTLANLAGLVLLLLVNTQDVHAENYRADQNKTELLERRIYELERRLEKLETLTSLLQPPQNTVQNEANVKELTNEVHVLEQKFDTQEELIQNNAKKTPIIEAGDSGFKISSADKKHQVRLRGIVQADNRTFTEDNSKSTDSFDLKQARIWFEGRVFNDVYFKISPNFASGSDILPDAYLDYAYHSAASLLVGKFKPALSLERLQGDTDGTFLERAFPAYLATNRDVGMELHGGFNFTGQSAEKVVGPIDTKNQFSYQFGIFNGSGDEGNLNNNAADVNDNKEFVGRLFAHPFQHSDYSWLEGLGIGVAGSYAHPLNLALNNQRTPIGRNSYLNYASTFTNATGSAFAAPVSNGDSYRIYPQAYWYAGSFGAMAEYVVSSQHLAGMNKTGALNIKQDNTAWQILGSYILTGENSSFGSVKPSRAFNPMENTWGALQIAARWSQLDVDSDTFLLIDPSKSARQARAWTVGANWYLNANALIRADYEQVSFDGGAAKGGNRPTEQLFATRFQLAF